jgi:hypothetical protein
MISRRKKTRCKFQSDRNVCDACAAAHVRCTFEDRERHQAVRDQHYAFVLAPPGTDLLSASDAGGQQSVEFSTYTPLGSEGASMGTFRSVTRASMMANNGYSSLPHIKTATTRVCRILLHDPCRHCLTPRSPLNQTQRCFLVLSRRTINSYTHPFP